MLGNRTTLVMKPGGAFFRPSTPRLPPRRGEKMRHQRFIFLDSVGRPPPHLYQHSQQMLSMFSSSEVGGTARRLGVPSSSRYAKNYHRCHRIVRDSSHKSILSRMMLFSLSQFVMFYRLAYAQQKADRS